jgi:molybdopterin-guanine dinucleotide biosynthesis protein A
VTFPDAIVLAGGSGRRLGGVDKPALVVGGKRLLDRVLAAVDASSVVVVVGPPRLTARPVLFATEQPPGGGPAAALAAGLPLVTSDVVGVLAADLPFVTADVVHHLTEQLGTRNGALIVDADGFDQLLLGVWRTAALRDAVKAAGPLANRGLHHVLGRLNPVRVVLPPATQPLAWWDCDTPADVRRAEEHS